MSDDTKCIQDLERQLQDAHRTIWMLVYRMDGHETTIDRRTLVEAPRAEHMALETVPNNHVDGITIRARYVAGHERESKAEFRNGGWNFVGVDRGISRDFTPDPSLADIQKGDPMRVSGIPGGDVQGVVREVRPTGSDGVDVTVETDEESFSGGYGGGKTVGFAKRHGIEVPVPGFTPDPDPTVEMPRDQVPGMAKKPGGLP